MRVDLLDLNGDVRTYTGVTQVSYVNQESFGPGDKIGLERIGSGQTLLVVNVNGFAAAAIAK